MSNSLVSKICTCVVLTLTVAVSSLASELSLAEVEKMALEANFTIKKLYAGSEKYNELAVAEGQLPDPVVKLGIMNLPVSGFSRSQEPMTQLQIGLRQVFPRGNTLNLRQEKTRRLAKIVDARTSLQTHKVLRAVRNSYLNVYLNQRTKQLLEENREMFSKLLEITKRQYAAGRGNQYDVLRAQLELSLIDDRLVEVQGRQEMAIADLRRWLGNVSAFDRVATRFPEFEALEDLQHMSMELKHHPQIQIEDAKITVNEKEVRLAEQQYKPAWMLDLTYGNRSGNNVDGSQRDDFVSAMVILDLPVFTDKRQDKRLAASKLDHIAAQFARSDRLLELRQALEMEYANWLQLDRRLELYKTQTVINAEQNSESTLNAYQNDLADFTTLMRARLTELDTQLNMLKIMVNRAKARVNLLYYSKEVL